MEDIKTKHQVYVPKRVREYMFELLSTFIAVALAFLSQYYFQYRSDRSTEHDLLASLISDLKADIKIIDEFETNLADFRSKAEELENLCLGNHSSLDVQIKMYKDSFYLTHFAYGMGFSESTLNQLKNAGGLRLIQDHEIASVINDYDSGSHGEAVTRTNIGIRKDEWLLTDSNLFRWSATDIQVKSLGEYQLNRIKYNFNKFGTALLFNDDINYAHYINKLSKYVEWIDQYGNSLAYMKKVEAQKLITLIQSRYHIE